MYFLIPIPILFLLLQALYHYEAPVIALVLILCGIFACMFAAILCTISFFDAGRADFNDAADRMDR